MKIWWFTTLKRQSTKKQKGLIVGKEKIRLLLFVGDRLRKLKSVYRWPNRISEFTKFAGNQSSM